MNEINTTNNTNVSIWEDTKSLEEVRKLFAPKLNDLEFKAFIGLGKASGLNPFLREIWSIKYSENAPAQIFIARDGYRKAAQKNPDYDYHQVDAVFENDNYKVRNGEIEHDYNLKDRGRLIGAYCMVKRHSSSRAMNVFVDISEYNTSQSVWKTKPATMIKKVAEAQALRQAFQEQFGGTYNEDEIVPESQTSKFKNKLKDTNEIHVDSNSGEIIEAREHTANIINEASESMPVKLDQLRQIKSLLKEKSFDDARLSKALLYFNVDDVTKLTERQSQEFIMMLGKV